MSQFICPKCYRPVLASDVTCAGCGHAARDQGWLPDPIIGKVIAGKYRIRSRLGAGGMGAVFRASQFHGAENLGEVVIKFLLAEYVSDAERRARFVKEARAARGLRSPHVVKVFDFGEDDGAPFLVMELLEGKSLFSIMADRGLVPVRRALRIGMQVAEAMVECHDKGILHRDLKPDNLLVEETHSGDFVKIVDFGIARVPTGQEGPKQQSMVSSLVIGTPRYMAPEQIIGQPIDGRIDIFALGVILFELMCGCSPIPLKEGDNEMAYVALNLTEPPLKVSDRLMGVPPELDALIDRMMAKSPEERPARMADVLLAIEHLLTLPQLGEERPSPEKEARVEAAAHLLVPRPAPPPARHLRTLPGLLGRRRYLVPALVGAVIGLTLLVVWLLTMSPVPVPPREAPAATREAPAPARADAPAAAPTPPPVAAPPPPVAAPAPAVAAPAPAPEPAEADRRRRSHRRKR